MRNTILVGDCRQTLKTVPEGSVHCCITSPPYWALRSYLKADHPNKALEIGSEPTPELFIETMVSVFREVRRCLRDDGLLFLNLGDSYSSGGRKSYRSGASANKGHDVQNELPRPEQPEGIKSGDLCNMPNRVASALQASHEVDCCVKSEIQRAWLAAMFDGEGCIWIRRYNSYRKDVQYQDGFVAYTSVGNNDVELLDRCVSITGFGSPRIKQRANSTDGRGIVSRRDNYGWRLDGNDAVDVIRAIYPYLIAKRKQACIAYTLDVLNKTRAREDGKVPAEIQEKKALLWELIKKCNQRQPVDLPSWVQEPKPKIEQGWFWRDTIIWHKPAPMPSSQNGVRWERCKVKLRGGWTNETHPSGVGRSGAFACDGTSPGRPLPTEWTPCPGCKKCEPNNGYVLRRGRFRTTTAHEYIYMFSKGEKYYADAESCKEIAIGGTPGNKTHKGKTAYEAGDEHHRTKVGLASMTAVETRLPRSVWKINPEPYKGAHFATYPSELAKRCLEMATCAHGCCGQCGAQRAPVVETERVATRPGRDNVLDESGMSNRDPERHIQKTKVLAYWPTCKCCVPSVHPIILDPFGGSGTTAQAARWLGRDYILCELNEEYAALAKIRIEKKPRWLETKKPAKKKAKRQRPSLF